MKVFFLFAQIFYSDDQIRSQFCTCHDSSAVMACAKLWPDWDIIFHKTVTCIIKRFGLWAHKSFVKWVSGSLLEFTKWKTQKYILAPSYLTVFWSTSFRFGVILKFDRSHRCLSSTGAEMPVKFQSNWIIWKFNPLALRLQYLMRMCLNA